MFRSLLLWCVMACQVTETPPTETGNEDTAATHPTHLSVGAQGNCLTAQRSTQCWGSIAGEMSPPSTPFTSVPNGLVDVAISSGSTSRFACGILADQTVGCWGENGGGQIGSFELEGNHPFTKIEGLNGVTRIATGSSHACAVADQGAVYCWGNNNLEAVGRPERTPKPPSGTPNPEPVPQQVLGLPPAIDVTCGMTHSCALLDDGTSRCWGRQNWGALGQAGVEQEEQGVQLFDPGLNEIRTLVADRDSTVALTEDGTLYGWGRGSGLVSMAEEPDICVVVVPKQCYLNPTVILRDGPQLSMDFQGDLVCSESDVGVLNCTGRTVGESSESGKLPPTITESYSQFGIGERHICLLLEDDTVICRGSASSGQFGSVMEFQDDWVQIILP